MATSRGGEFTRLVHDLANVFRRPAALFPPPLPWLLAAFVYKSVLARSLVPFSPSFPLVLLPPVPLLRGRLLRYLPESSKVKRGRKWGKGEKETRRGGRKMGVKSVSMSTAVEIKEKLGGEKKGKAKITWVLKKSYSLNAGCAEQRARVRRGEARPRPHQRAAGGQL